jgi:hypothetical protein
MFHATREDQELALLQPDVPISKLHTKSAFEDAEKFVLVGMAVF